MFPRNDALVAVDSSPIDDVPIEASLLGLPQELRAMIYGFAFPKLAARHTVYDTDSIFSIELRGGLRVQPGDDDIGNHLDGPWAMMSANRVFANELTRFLIPIRFIRFRFVHMTVTDMDRWISLMGLYRIRDMRKLTFEGWGKCHWAR